MHLYNFTEYISDHRIKKTGDRALSDPVILFRGEYPEHVIRTSLCFKMIFKYPKKWRFILKKYKVSKKKFKEMLGSSYINTKIIITIKKRHYHESE